jgi:hypothetical protein
MIGLSLSLSAPLVAHAEGKHGTAPTRESVELLNRKLKVLKTTLAAALREVDQYQGQINAMLNNNLMFLAIQTKVQNMSQAFQAMSNILKADSDAKLNAVRNFRP